MNTGDVTDLERVAPGPTLREVTNQTTLVTMQAGDVMIQTVGITPTTVKLTKATVMAHLPPFFETGGGMPGTKRAAPKTKRPSEPAHAASMSVREKSSPTKRRGCPASLAVA